jgi:hypothetical protein
MANGQDTFLEITRQLRLYVPELPITLAEQFIRDRYRRILERRDWSASKRESQFLLNASKSTGSVAFVRGLLTVVGTGTSFDANDVGRQFKAGQGSPVYTITAVDVGLQTLTLNMPIGIPTSVNAGYWVLDAFVTPPTDFLQFVVVANPIQGWRLRHWITAQELMVMDPQRTFMGQPYILADRLFSNDGLGMVQYEAWPYATTQQTLYYQYLARPDDLIQATDIPIWPIRTDAIVAGALADVARWPGTRTSPNPYFTRPEYWRAYEMEYEDKMIEIERRDESIYMTMLENYPYNNLPFAPLSAAWMQTHAV